MKLFKYALRSPEDDGVAGIRQGNFPSIGLSRFGLSSIQDVYGGESGCKQRHMRPQREIIRDL